jgi:hypothetical protein
MQNPEFGKPLAAEATGKNRPGNWITTMIVMGDYWVFGF